MTKYPYRKWGASKSFLIRKGGGVPAAPALEGKWVKFPNDPNRAGLYVRSALVSSNSVRAKCEIVIRFHNGLNPGVIFWANDMALDLNLQPNGKYRFGSYRVNQGQVAVASADLNLEANKTYTIVVEVAINNTAGPGKNRGYSVMLDGVEVMHHTTAQWQRPAWEGGAVMTSLVFTDLSLFGNEYNADRQLEVACRSFRWWKDDAASVSWQLVDQTAAQWLAATSKTPGWFRGYGTITDLV